MRQAAAISAHEAAELKLERALADLETSKSSSQERESLLAALGGVLFALDVGSIQPAVMGNFYELYAIAAAVLGGCSLRGGEGSILGVVLGAAVMRLLYNSIVLLGIPSQLEFAIVGGVLLLGAIADETVRKIAGKRRAAERARARSKDTPS